MIFSQETGNIFPAFIRAQAHFRKAEKDRENTFFGAKYADLASYFDACSEGLINFDLGFIQDPKTSYRQDKNPAWAKDWKPITKKDENRLQPPPFIYLVDCEVVTRIIHVSGEWIESAPLKIMASEMTAQQVGKLITYGKRYSVSAMLGLASEDNDGNTPQQTQIDSKVARGLRSQLNQALLAATSPEDLETAFDLFTAENDIDMNQLTGVRSGETYNSLADEHRQGVLKRKPVEKVLEDVKKTFKEVSGKCDDVQTFDMLQQLYLDNTELQTKENEAFLNKRGKELEIPDYMEETTDGK